MKSTTELTRGTASKSLYKNPPKRKRGRSAETFFYLVKIGNSIHSLIIQSTESYYYRIRENVQQLVDAGSFGSVFEDGQVFCERIHRIPTSELTDHKRDEIIHSIKRNFTDSISFDELKSRIEQHNNNSRRKTVMDFFINELSEEDIRNDLEELKQVVPLSNSTKADFYLKAVNSRFPDFAKKLDREFRALEKEMMIV